VSAADVEAIVSRVTGKPSIELDSLEGLSARGFQVSFESHAKAILNIDFPEALHELDGVLRTFTVPIEVLVGSGGGETKLTQNLRRRFAELGWVKHNFEISKLIDGVQRESVSHEVDHVRTLAAGKVAMEIEWNNKDPFFDRDLENFKRLHADAAISVGVIITRGASLQKGTHALVRRFAEEREIGSYDDLVKFDVRPTARQMRLVRLRMERVGSMFADAWTDQFVSDKYGPSTTHWRKLEDRILRGVGNPCPLLLIGIPERAVTFGSADPLENATQVARFDESIVTDHQTDEES